MILESISSIFNTYKKLQVLEILKVLPRIITKQVIRVCFTVILGSVSSNFNTSKIKKFQMLERIKTLPKITIKHTLNTNLILGEDSFED